MSLSIYCPHCQQFTALNKAAKSHRDSTGVITAVFAEWKKDANDKWWIGICNSCHLPCLVLNDGETIYPSALPSRTDSHIPDNLAKDLDEAKMCFSVGCYRACAVIARRCIQNACLEKGAKKDDLVTQIKELKKNNIITKDIEEWATVVRWIGNDAAHPGNDEVEKEDAKDTLKLAEEFLHVIFVTPAVAKERRAKRGK